MATSVTSGERSMPLANRSSIDGTYGDIIAIGNLEGGVGKSTLAVGLAGAMARTSKSVALVDGDPQATSRRWLVRSDLPVRVETMDLDILSSLENWLGRAERLVRAHGTMIVDLPAVIGPAMASAFLLARVILVPVSLSAVDIDGTNRVLRYIRVARSERGGRRRHRPAAAAAAAMVAAPLCILTCSFERSQHVTAADDMAAGRS